MTQQPGGEELNFEHAQYDGRAPSAIACHLCRGQLGRQYYSLNGQPVCDACLAKAKLGQQSSFFKALGLGLVAGAIGAAIYYGIRELTGYDLALITIVVGIMVGVAVRMGAGGSRSVLYRVMALGITYVAMCATYVPTIASSLETDSSSPIAVASIVALTVPFVLIRKAEVLALLIFGFGLWEAWRLSAPRAFSVEGPFESSPTPRAQ